MDVSTTITYAGPGSIVPMSTDTRKETVLQKIEKLRDLVSHSYGKNLSEVNRHLSSAIALLQSTDEQQDFVTKKHPAPNSNSTTQEYFYSTKKKGKSLSIRLKNQQMKSVLQSNPD